MVNAQAQRECTSKGPFYLGNGNQFRQVQYSGCGGENREDGLEEWAEVRLQKLLTAQRRSLDFTMICQDFSFISLGTTSISSASEFLKVRDAPSHPLPSSRVWPRWTWDGEASLLLLGSLLQQRPAFWASYRPQCQPPPCFHME